MNLKPLRCAYIALLFCTAHPETETVIKMGDLNIIQDTGNPSNRLRFLDLSFSRHLSLADALSNAQTMYSNVRSATASELDDFVATAGIYYNAGLTASGAFTTGPLLRSPQAPTMAEVLFSCS